MSDRRRPRVTPATTAVRVGGAPPRALARGVYHAHRSACKHEVGIRELHDQLSRYVRHAASGGEVVVTMRGRPVARLSSFAATDPLADLRARGLVQEPTAEWRPPTRRIRPSASVSDLVAEQRR